MNMTSPTDSYVSGVPTNSCELNVPRFELERDTEQAERASNLCRSLHSKFPGSSFVYNSEAGKLKITTLNEEASLCVYDHLDECVEAVEADGMVNEDGHIVANASAISALEPSTEIIHEHVILQHKDGSTSITPGARPTPDSYTGPGERVSMNVVPRRGEGTEKAFVCRGTLSYATIGPTWSHMATDAFPVSRQDDRARTMLQMWMDGTHQSENVPSQKQGHEVI